ncbi:MAG: L-histidine N(alpha)-methyltransferase [Phycisphaerales bacterium]|nr:L-histidine N(alpha)-methyltransferase [Phycisphaerales bacterium]
MIHPTPDQFHHCAVTTGGTVTEASPAVELLDFHPAPADVRAEVIAGLSKPQKSLPCKFFYDERGSSLFDAICELPEYYPTRTESRITRDNADAIANAVGPNALLVEYGSGSSLKTRILLDHLHDLAGYVPIDISKTHLMASAESIAGAYPGLPVKAVCADYTRPVTLPTFDGDPRSVVAYFPGSTIGNFEPEEALAFLQSVRKTCGPGSSLLIGVDLKKDPARLHAAYNDAAGVTAAFNLNVLRHINRELGSDFNEDAFHHHAFYNVPLGRMEMHLVSKRRQSVTVGSGTFDFDDGESIHTESCHKYTVNSFRRLASSAGYSASVAWTDPSSQFSLHQLSA